MAINRSPFLVMDIVAKTQLAAVLVDVPFEVSWYRMPKNKYALCLFYDGLRHDFVDESWETCIRNALQKVMLWRAQYER